MSHEAPAPQHSVEKSHNTAPQAPKTAEKGSTFEGIDDKQLVAAEQKDERQMLDAAAKQEALSVMEELKDPALGAEQNLHGTGVANKTGHREGRLGESVKSAYANYSPEHATLSVEDFGQKGSSSVVFNIPAEVVADLNAERQRDGKIDVDDLEKAVQNPDTHVSHFGAVADKWDAASNRGTAVNVSPSGKIRVSSPDEGYNYDGVGDPTPDKIARPADVTGIITLAKEVNKEKAS
ncbi:MAG TPA: hypothetical protein VFZ58_04140 [Candidatus Saccharimonadales bacterium]